MRARSQLSVQEFFRMICLLFPVESQVLVTFIPRGVVEIFVT